jgi:hypothetical protein
MLHEDTTSTHRAQARWKQGELRMRLPTTLTNTDDAAAVGALECYYGTGAHADHGCFTGAWFDTWDSTGTRDQDVDRFTADDLVAVSFLSVDVPPVAARMLLQTEAAKFAELLAELGPDRDLVEVKEPWGEDWAGSRLWRELVDLPDVGPTLASKLYARKRPRLRPIYDSVVESVIGQKSLWEPLRAQLQAEPDLHPRLEALRGRAQLPGGVSALRVFDVLAWMAGRYDSTCPRRSSGGPVAETEPRSD